MNIQSKVNYFLSLSYYELEHACGDNYQKVYYYLKNNHPNVKPNQLLVGCIFTAIAADGKLNDNEWSFVKTFIGGYSYDEAFNTASEFYSEQAQQTTMEILKKFPYDIKDALINVIVAVLCVDGRYSDYEASFINRIL